MILSPIIRALDLTPPHPPRQNETMDTQARQDTIRLRNRESCSIYHPPDSPPSKGALKAIHFIDNIPTLRSSSIPIPSDSKKLHGSNCELGRYTQDPWLTGTLEYTYPPCAGIWLVSPECDFGTPPSVQTHKPHYPQTPPKCPERLEESKGNKASEKEGRR